MESFNLKEIIYISDNILHIGICYMYVHHKQKRLQDLKLDR